MDRADEFEPLDLGDEAHTPADLVELYEALAWQAAVAEAEGQGGHPVP